MIRKVGRENSRQLNTERPAVNTEHLQLYSTAGQCALISKDKDLDVGNLVLGWTRPSENVQARIELANLVQGHVEENVDLQTEVD